MAVTCHLPWHEHDIIAFATIVPDRLYALHAFTDGLLPCVVNPAAGAFAPWHLDFIEVHDPATPTVTYFPCFRWLSASEDDGLVRRTLPAMDRHPNELKTTFRVTVKTSNLMGAGTDATVFINIFGANGETGKRTLDIEFK